MHGQPHIRLHYVFIEMCSDSLARTLMLGVTVAGGAQNSGGSRCLSSSSFNRTHLRNTSPTPNTGILDTYRPTTRKKIGMLIAEIFIEVTGNIVHGSGQSAIFFNVETAVNKRLPQRCRKVNQFQICSSLLVTADNAYDATLVLLKALLRFSF